MLVINTRNGEVVEWDREDGVGDVVAHSFTSYVEDYRNSLLGGHMEYLNDVGVIENMVGGKSRK
jgi:hypothetical protein